MLSHSSLIRTPATATAAVVRLLTPLLPSSSARFRLSLSRRHPFHLASLHETIASCTHLHLGFLSRASSSSSRVIATSSPDMPARQHDQSTAATSSRARSVSSSPPPTIKTVMSPPPKRAKLDHTPEARRTNDQDQDRDQEQDQAHNELNPQAKDTPKPRRGQQGPKAAAAPNDERRRLRAKLAARRERLAKQGEDPIWFDIVDMLPADALRPPPPPPPPAPPSLSSSTAPSPPSPPSSESAQDALERWFHRTRFVRGQLLELTIQRLSAHGDGLAAVSPSDEAADGADGAAAGAEAQAQAAPSSSSSRPDWVVCVPKALPGERVRCRVWSNERLHSKADLLEILSAPGDATTASSDAAPHLVSSDQGGPGVSGGSSSRGVGVGVGVGVDGDASLSASFEGMRLERRPELVRCRYFASCGGCQYQMLPYEQQLVLKQRVVRRAFEHYSGLSASDLPAVRPTIGSPSQYAYRTKLTPHFELPRGLRAVQSSARRAARANGKGRRGRDAAGRAAAAQEAADEAEAKASELGNDELWVNIGFDRLGGGGGGMGGSSDSGEGQAAGSTRATTRPDAILDIEECPIATEAINAELPAVRRRVRERIREYRNGATLLLRDSLRDSLRDFDDDVDGDDGGGGGVGGGGGAASAVSGKAGDERPATSATTPTRQAASSRRSVVVTEHRQTVRERVGALRFESPAGAFFQNNRSVLPRLVGAVREAVLALRGAEHDDEGGGEGGDAQAGRADGERLVDGSTRPHGDALPVPRAGRDPRRRHYLVDAYCGSGFFALCLADLFDEVAGVEISVESVRCAERNATLNAGLLRRRVPCLGDGGGGHDDGAPAAGGGAGGADGGDAVARSDGKDSRVHDGSAVRAPAEDAIASTTTAEAAAAAASAKAEVGGETQTSKVRFLAGNAEDIFATITFPPSRTTVLIDPPRRGCDAGFLGQLLRLAPRYVVYVSCNVHTQARDVGVLVRGELRGSGLVPEDPVGGTPGTGVAAGEGADADGGEDAGGGGGATRAAVAVEGRAEARANKVRYEVVSLGGLDMFPQTHHVEGLAVLRRRDD